MKIIFDLDGTLFQTIFCIINAVNKLFDQLNLARINEQLVIENIGKKNDEFLTSILPQNIKVDDVCSAFRELEHTEIEHNSKLFDNTREMLEGLSSEGYSLYICSNGSNEYIDLVLQKTGIDNYFTEKYSAKKYKIKAEAIKAIIDANEAAIVVGDTYSDIEAASLNNIPSIAALYGYGIDEELHGATFSVNSTMEVIDYVKKIDVFYSIKKQLIDNGKKIIGISGVDTSGKTSFTNKFARFLSSLAIKNTILHIDDFHNPSAIRYQGNNEIDAYYDNAFNYKQVIDEVLQPLKQHGKIDKTVLCLNLDTDLYENNMHYIIDGDTVLLIEGVLLFRKPLINYLDGRVFLNISFDEVLKRAKVRDVPKYGEKFLQKYINKYIPIQKRYIDEYQPQIKSDIVINNEDYLNPKIELINNQSR